MKQYNGYWTVRNSIIVRKFEKEPYTLYRIYYIIKLHYVILLTLHSWWRTLPPSKKSWLWIPIAWGCWHAVRRSRNSLSTGQLSSAAFRGSSLARGTNEWMKQSGSDLGTRGFPERWWRFTIFSTLNTFRVHVRSTTWRFDERFLSRQTKAFWRDRRCWGLEPQHT
jgi:hypothetical protein